MIIVPGPRRPFAVAETYAEVRERDRKPLRRWRGDWYVYSEVRWVKTEVDDVRADLVAWLTGDEVRTRVDGELTRWQPNRDTDIANVLAMLGDVCHRPAAADVPRGVFLSNLWLDERQVPCDYSPGVFNLSAARYGWNVKAECPKTLAWLNDILSPADVELLRQWLGYLLSKRTDLQKMLVLLGPPRSGKGTLFWMMEELLGPGSTASITALGELTATFGLQPLIGAELAVIPDVRWSTRDASDAVPHLLSISGEDSKDVQRKQMRVWRGRLGVRFVIGSNDTPSLADASGALAGRMLIITMQKTFLGKEDPMLKETIRVEMPGVLQWALGGLKTLTAAGRFAEPQSSVDMREEVREAGNPVYLFAEDMLIVGPYGKVMLDDLYRVYEIWCQKNGQGRLPSSILVRQLRNTFRGKVTSVRQRQPGTGVQKRMVLGLTRITAPEYADDPLYE